MAEIVAVVHQRHLDRLRPEHERDQLVDDKRRRRHDDLVARPQQRMAEQLDDLVRAVAHDELVRAEPFDLRQLLPQRKAPAVRVKLPLHQRLLRRRQRARRGPERVFIRGQLDEARRVEPELARDILNRLAGLIDRLRQHHGIDQRLELHPAMRTEFTAPANSQFWPSSKVETRNPKEIPMGWNA